MTFADADDELQTVCRDLTKFQRNILVVLAEEPRYGLAIKQELEDYYDDEVNHGRLYPNLDELVDYGFVEKSELDKRTNQYELTGDGYEAVLDLLAWEFSYVCTEGGKVDDVREIVASQE